VVMRGSSDTARIPQGSPDPVPSSSLTAPKPPTSITTALAQSLYQLATAAEAAESIEQLLGYEGAGANAWYSHFQDRCHSRFPFPGRRAPRAEDPLNILLNIGFTALYNWTAHFLRIHGFAPTLGILHEHRTGHAGLASDLMEPFRHLIDAVVLDFSNSLSIQDFVPDAKGPFATEIKFPALKRFRATLWKRLQTAHQPTNRNAAIPYLKSMEQQANHLRRHLLERNSKFVPFEQTESIQ
jgi:CRISPR-associated endonuclease Cas1